MTEYKHKIKTCLNNKCKTDHTHLFYDKDDKTFYCNKCKTGWKVKPYTPPPRCDECKSRKLKFDRDRCEIYCQKCGLVVSGNISYVQGIRVIYPKGLRI